MGRRAGGHTVAGKKSIAMRLYRTSGRSWITRCGLQMSRLLISVTRPPCAMHASVAATMPGDVRLLSATSIGPAGTEDLVAPAVEGLRGYTGKC